MDGGRRDPEPLVARRGDAAASGNRPERWGWFTRRRPRRAAHAHGRANPVARARLAGRLGLTALFAGTISYGIVLGGHGPVAASAIAQVPDVVASIFGFRIEAIVVTGQVELTTEEIIDAVGLDATRSLVFLDAGVARDQLLALPLVESASVRKFYPDRVEIEVTERKPYAVWQNEGSFSVISADGTSIDSARDGRFSNLPLVVGEGADKAAPAFLPVLSRYPVVARKTYGAVRVGDRRWNLRLVNGVDVKLPDDKLEAALAHLTTLIKDQDILSRDLVSIDLRDEAHVLVRLSPEAAKAQAEAMAKAKKTKGAT
jgi:cell division protein FtsQ